MRRLIWGFAGRTYHIVGNLMPQLNYVREENITKMSCIWTPASPQGVNPGVSAYGTLEDPKRHTYSNNIWFLKTDYKDMYLNAVNLEIIFEGLYLCETLYRENETLAKWRNHSVIYWYMLIQK